MNVERMCKSERERASEKKKNIYIYIYIYIYESDHVSSVWNGTCFHILSTAPLKLRDGNTYTLMYTHTYTERDTYTTVTKNPSYLRRTV